MNLHFDRLRASSEDGKIVLHDTRVDNRLSSAQATLQYAAEFTGVQAHPIMEHIFATSDSHGQVCLRDTRMAFGPLSARSNQGIVQNVSLPRPSMAAAHPFNYPKVQYKVVKTVSKLSEQSRK